MPPSTLFPILLLLVFLFLTPTFAACPCKCFTKRLNFRPRKAAARQCRRRVNANICRVQRCYVWKSKERYRTRKGFECCDAPALPGTSRTPSPSPSRTPPVTIAPVVTTTTTVLTPVTPATVPQPQPVQPPSAPAA